MDEQGLVDGFALDAYGVIIGGVKQQSADNLLRLPAIDPHAITAMRFVAADERHLLRACDLMSSCIMKRFLKAFLDIFAQPRIHHQFGRLGASSQEL